MSDTDYLRARLNRAIALLKEADECIPWFEEDGDECFNIEENIKISKAIEAFLSEESA